MLKIFKKHRKRSRKTDTSLDLGSDKKAIAKIALKRKHEAISKPLRPNLAPLIPLANRARGLQLLKQSVSTSSLPARRQLHAPHAYTLANPNRIMATQSPRLQFENFKKSPCKQRKERRSVIMIKTRGRGMRVKRAKWNESSKIICKG